MNSFEKFEKGFLSDLARPGMSSPRHFQDFQLARQYGISTEHVRELMIQFAQRRLISLKSWDGHGVRSWDEWDKPENVFERATDLHARVTLLATGAALVEDLPANPIGFVIT